MRSTQRNRISIRKVGRRLCRMRAAQLWREGHLTRHVSKYLRQRFPSVCHTS